eukprot:jgi/Mesvir1/2567/Mv10312-RA.1
MENDQLHMRFNNESTGVSRDALTYKEDASGPKAPAVAPYWQFSNDVRIADGHDLLVTGKVILGGAPTEPNDAVTKAYADAIAVVPAALSDATDVEYTGTPSSNDVLAWNGTVWTNTPIRVPYWTEVYHYSGDMSGSTTVTMVTGGGNALSAPAPFQFVKTVMGVRAAWANVPITPITIALNDVVYVQLSDYTGTNIAVAVQLTSSNLGT